MWVTRICRVTTAPLKHPETPNHQSCCHLPGELHQGRGCRAATRDCRGGGPGRAGPSGTGQSRAVPGRTERGRAVPKLRAPLPLPRAGPQRQSATFPPPNSASRPAALARAAALPAYTWRAEGGGAVREDEGGGHVGSRGARVVLSAPPRAVPRAQLCGERLLGAAGGQRLLRLRVGLAWLLVSSLRSPRQRRRGVPDRETAP